MNIQYRLIYYVLYLNIQCALIYYVLYQEDYIVKCQSYTRERK